MKTFKEFEIVSYYLKNVLTKIILFETLKTNYFCGADYEYLVQDPHPQVFSTPTQSFSFPSLHEQCPVVTPCLKHHLGVSLFALI